MSRTVQETTTLSERIRKCNEIKHENNALLIEYADYTRSTNNPESWTLFMIDFPIWTRQTSTKPKPDESHDRKW